MSKHDFVPVVGLIGGVGSGKSSVARWLAAEHSVVVVAGDEAGHQVLKIPSVKSQIRARFGDEVFDSHGEVNRSALGQLVFGSEPERQRSRADLESIVHPEIRKEITRQIATAKASEQTRAVLLDAAVLFEAGWNDLCDAVVFIDVPSTDRLERLSKQRGWGTLEFQTRENSQLPLAEKRRRSDYVVDNSGSLGDAGSQLQAILERLGRPL